MDITILFDNYLYKEGLQTGWGFSCLIEGLEKIILFDTGSDTRVDGNILLSNMEKLGIEPKNIDIIFLSHEHYDHIGGLDVLLTKNPDSTIYFPVSFSSGFKEKYSAKGITISESTEVCKDTHSTGEFGTWMKEQSLVLKTTKGLVVITGCAHPGIVKTIEKVKELFKEEINLVMGGFHLAGWSDSELKEVINNFKGLGVKRAAPSHCSGERTIELFKQEYGENFVKLGVGRKLAISE